MDNENPRGAIIGKILSPIGIFISIGVAVGALVIVLITTQVQDCAKSKDGFATVIHHVDTRYSGYVVFVTAAGTSSIIGGGFITPDNGDVQVSIKPGRYDIHQYYVRSDTHRVMYDFVVGDSSGLPIEEIYDTYGTDRNVRLCSGDEYHILAWNQPN